MANSKKEKELATTSNNDLAIFGDNAGEVANFAGDADMGHEHVGVNDLATPRIVLLQAQSKTVVDGLEGARAGLFHNTITDELFSECYVIPLDYRREYAVFTKRDLGGGFEGSFLSSQEAADFRDTLDGDAQNYDIIESARHTLLILDDTGKPEQPALMHFSSTGLGISDSFNSAIKLTLPAGAPRFAGVWKMSAEKKEKKSFKWHAPSFDFVGLCRQSLYDAAKETFLSVTGKNLQNEDAEKAA